MKLKSIFQSVLYGTLGLTSAAHAANGVWTNAASGDWSTGPWTGGTPNGSGEVATFNQNWTGQVINVDGSYSVGQILAADSTSGGGLTISGGTLTLANGPSQPIIQTDAGFVESAVTRLKLTSVLDGTNGFNKTGAGYLDLSGSTNTFSGLVTLTGTTGGSFTVINGDANLGDVANTITVATSGNATGFYNDAAVGAFTLNSARNIATTGTGDFWVKNKSGANMTIAGVISGTANLRKNDSGTLTLTGANSYTGVTKIEGGTLMLSGGDNRLKSTGTVQFLNAATLDLTSTSQTVSGLTLLTSGAKQTITGSGGTLILNAASDQTWNTTVTGNTVDMSGLSNFTLNRTAGTFQFNANGASVFNTIDLAKAGTNEINATNVRFGGGSNNAGQNVVVGLGQTNNINASGEFVIGYFQGNGDVAFQSGLTNATLTVRGAGGSGAIPLMTVGSTNSGNQSSTGILNLTGGSLDVIATEFNVARHFANASGTSATGTVTMPAGTVVADILNLALKTNTTGTPTLTGTFNQGGGTVTATTLNLGNNANGELVNQIANYNLTGGMLYATTITGTGNYGGSTVRNLNLDGGTLSNKSGGDLSINGVDATSAGRININVTSSSIITVDATRTATLGTNTALTGSAAVSKTGDGSMVIEGVSSSYTGTFTVDNGILLINDTGGFGGSGGAVGVSSGATLGGSGSISVATTITSGGIHTAATAVTAATPIATLGKETFTTGITYNQGSIFEWNLTGDTETSIGTRGINYDAINTSTVATTGTGAIFRLVLNAGQDFGEAFWDTDRTWTDIFTDVTGSSNLNITSIFGGGFEYFNASGTVLGVTSAQGEFSFTDGGSSLTWTAVPEPTSALAGLLIGAGLLRRRRCA